MSGIISTVQGDDGDGRPDDGTCSLVVASERLSTVRYVFLVQIEDGIATAAERASLEYADAVLIGWPDVDSREIHALDAQELEAVSEHIGAMESYISSFVEMERKGDVDGMTDTLIRITGRVAEIRRLYQPDFLLPTFAEIRRVVQEEWDEDMGKIDPQEPEPSEQELEDDIRRDDAEESEQDAVSVRAEGHPSGEASS
ncbi:MAG: phosphoribosylglycinamide synthetase [Bifidobacterium sp.]|jgi:hypothetical protein|nr:phosphoribosylglycinamide synthetase [Bifidobacterium sp.]MCI1865567.1 phosphoribosylglycinamide synthetase [Bifidobacterium sp.]